MMSTFKKIGVVIGSIPGLAASAIRYSTFSVAISFARFVDESFER